MAVFHVFILYEIPQSVSYYFVKQFVSIKVFAFTRDSKVSKSVGEANIATT